MPLNPEGWTVPAHWFVIHLSTPRMSNDYTAGKIKYPNKVQNENENYKNNNIIKITTLHLCMLRIKVSINIKSIYSCNTYAYRFSRSHRTRK